MKVSQKEKLAAGSKEVDHGAAARANWMEPQLIKDFSGEEIVSIAGVSTIQPYGVYDLTLWYLETIMYDLP